MGTDKALLTLPDGRTLLRAVLEAAQPLGGHVLVSVDSLEHGIALRDAMPHPIDVLLDRAPGEGPLAALGQAAEHAGEGAVLLLAVDMPLVSSDLLYALYRSWLNGRSHGIQVVAPFAENRVQPMPACYAAALHSLVEQLLQAGHRAMRALLQAPAVCLQTLDEATLRRVDPDLLGLSRVNTPDSWRELCARLGDSRAGDMRYS
jgi:molybdopterin-guanine dinucleotide biosynthesis protein A